MENGTLSLDKTSYLSDTRPSALVFDDIYNHGGFGAVYGVGRKVYIVNNSNNANILRTALCTNMQYDLQLEQVYQHSSEVVAVLASDYRMIRGKEIFVVDRENNIITLSLGEGRFFTRSTSIINATGAISDNVVGLAMFDGNQAGR